jgi:murein DD-endopeptidase MepM/ murein hydrolase activator NlpD
VALRSAPSQDDTRCGIVDLLDFPLNPPDGDGVARGGTDFGVYRGRYEQYHTGEDWWLGRGRSNFGAPVYSIGHGRVTYAAPLGWGRDQGIVIVQHSFADGRQLLSFYGHLDPPSVTLNAGECVRRGQLVGLIGRPRTPPHLHFEIRSHMPDESGGGYWWQDPTLDGWKPPSQTIWQERMSASPGVEWLRPPAGRNGVVIGLQDDHTIIVLEDHQLTGLDTTTGEERWSVTPEDRIDAATLYATQPLLYAAGQLGQIEAFRLPNLAMGDSEAFPEDILSPLWVVDLDVVGIPTLIALPQGGVVLAVWNDMIGLSATGDVLWQEDTFDRTLDWATVGDQLLLSTVGRERSVWTIDESGPRPWAGLTGGSLSAQSDHALLFNDQGLFKLNPDDGSHELLSEWPQDSLRASDVMVLEDGSALVVYLSRSDRRLILFDSQGNVMWQRALPDTITGTPTLQPVDGRPYLVVQSESGGTGSISVFAVDTSNIALTRIFNGGTRMPRISQNSFYSAGNGRLLINIGGGHLVSLDPRSAADGMVTARGSAAQ